MYKSVLGKINKLQKKKRYKQKIIVHNGDNYTNKFYNMIYLDINNKVNIKKNKVK